MLSIQCTLIFNYKLIFTRNNSHFILLFICDQWTLARSTHARVWTRRGSRWANRRTARRAALQSQIAIGTLLRWLLSSLLQLPLLLRLLLRLESQYSYNISPVLTLKWLIIFWATSSMSTFETWGNPMTGNQTMMFSGSLTQQPILTFYLSLARAADSSVGGNASIRSAHRGRRVAAGHLINLAIPILVHTLSAHRTAAPRYRHVPSTYCIANKTGLHISHTPYSFYYCSSMAWPSHFTIRQLPLYLFIGVRDCDFKIWNFIKWSQVTQI